MASTQGCVIINGEKFQTPNRIHSFESTPESTSKSELQHNYNSRSNCQQLKDRLSQRRTNAGEAPNRSISQLNSDEWPEFSSIIQKISTLQTRLAQQCQLNLSFSQEISRLKAIIEKYETEQHNNSCQFKANGSHNQEECNQRVKQLQDQLQEKQDQLTSQQETVAELQVQHVKKVADFEAKIKKMNADQKDTNQKLRKANLELQSERKHNIEIKKEMTTRIQQLQSEKESYLQGQVNKLKDIISKSREEKEKNLLEEIIELRRKIFQLQEDLRKADIRMSLMERKKQQAITEAVHKKDQQIKMQKTLNKTLHQKIAKLQTDKKTALKKTSENPRANKSMSMNSIRVVEQQVRLSLSPEVLSH